MSLQTRKFIALLMLLWLPIFTGNALAAAVTMQLAQGECLEVAMSHDAMNMQMDMSEDMGQHQHHGDMPVPADEHSPSCNDCGVCHLACTGYLAVPGDSIAALQTAVREITPFLVVINSVTTVPLLPPPLVRA